MNSKEKIKNIKSVINEFYHKEKCEGRLTECANDCWKSYQKVCDEIEQDLDRLKQLEKELKQTKLNFRNSQTHSKNCYKKLKEKYTRLERAYKNNEVMTRDLNELINRNLELGKDYDAKDLECIDLLKENQRLKKVRDNYSDQLNYVWNIVNSLKDENTRLKQAIKILKAKLIPILLLQEVDTLEEYNEGLDDCDEYRLTQEEFDLLKKVFESVGDSDEKEN